MPDKTIAYSNRGGFWKTRYTFFSSCYAFVDRCLISFAKSFVSDAVWKHDENETRTSFYGGVPAGSGVSVTFNENPSQNKVYKAFSLESTNNVTGDSTFTVNNSSVPAQTKEVQAAPLVERGGIMYGHIGMETRSSGSNVRLVGRIRNVDAFIPTGLPPAVVYNVDFAEGGKSNLSKLLISSAGAPNSTKFFIYNNSPAENQAQYFTINSATAIDPSLDYDQFPSDLILASNAETNTTEESIFLTPTFTGEQDFATYLEEIGPVGQDIYSSGEFLLFSITPESINGESPKGQTADAVINLGSAPYELYALNVEYSPTDLDHSK